MERHHISGIPVVESPAGKGAGKLVGILTNRDVRFATDPRQPVHELMTKDKLVTAPEGVSMAEAKKLLHQHRIEKILVVDEAYRCVGLITVKDIEKAQKFPNACKDERGRLRVAAATGVGEDGLRRALGLVEAECDLVVVDTAHGHSRGVMDTISRIKKEIELHPGAGRQYRHRRCGPRADRCRRRCHQGRHRPGLHLHHAHRRRCRACPSSPRSWMRSRSPIRPASRWSPMAASNIPAIWPRRIAAGADVAMVGSLLAGTEESPGEVFLYQGRTYKGYRGMGSVGAMARGSADRYFQAEVKDTLKLVPEGVEGQVPYKGPVSSVVHQIIGGLRAAMGYTGCATIADFHDQRRIRAHHRRGHARKPCP